MTIYSSFIKGLVLPALFSLAVAVPANADGYKAGALEIDHPWSRETPPGATTGAGYLSVKNTGTTEDRLVAVETAAAERVEIHQSIQEDGVAKMRPAKDGVPLPAGAETVLKPGGYHVMLIGLKEPLAHGMRVPAVLVFERAGRLEVELSVENMGYGAAQDHHKHH